jgi:hypothetical protein
MHVYLEQYVSLLWSMFQRDLTIFSHPWMYYWLLVPALCYLVFFFVKWTVLTTPIWLPIALALSPLRMRQHCRSK